MNNERLVNLSGSPFERGRSYGILHGEKIKRFYQSKCHEFSHLTKEWEKMATMQMAKMKQHCPIAYAEMEGTASVDDSVTMQMLMKLTIFPELEAFDHFHPYRCDGCSEVIEDESYVKTETSEFDFCKECKSSSIITRTTASTTVAPATIKSESGKKCSSFARCEKNSYIVGQTDEENPPYNQHGLLHVIQRMTDEDGNQSLFYTAPGTPAMLGMTSHGLSIVTNTLFVRSERASERKKDGNSEERSGHLLFCFLTLFVNNRSQTTNFGMAFLRSRPLASC